MSMGMELRPVAAITENVKSRLCVKIGILRVLVYLQQSTCYQKVERWQMGHGRNHYILVVIRITLR